MIRKFFKKQNFNLRLSSIITKYKIPRAYLSINRNSVSKAVLVGLFIAFIPMPMQMAAVILMVPFIKFNVPIALGIVWITNPVTLPFIYYGELVVGDLITFTPVSQDFNFIVELFTMEWFSSAFLSKLMEIIIPMYIGAFFVATVTSTVAYYGVRYFWWRSVHNEKLRKEERFHNK